MYNFALCDSGLLILVQLKEGEASLLDVLSLLLASVIFVPLFQRIPGGMSFFN